MREKRERERERENFNGCVAFFVNGYPERMFTRHGTIIPRHPVAQGLYYYNLAVGELKRNFVVVTKRVGLEVGKRGRR